MERLSSELSKFKKEAECGWQHIKCLEAENLMLRQQLANKAHSPEEVTCKAVLALDSEVTFKHSAARKLPCALVVGAIASLSEIAK